MKVCFRVIDGFIPVLDPFTSWPSVPRATSAFDIFQIRRGGHLTVGPSSGCLNLQWTCVCKYTPITTCGARAFSASDLFFFFLGESVAGWAEWNQRLGMNFYNNHNISIFSCEKEIRKGTKKFPFVLHPSVLYRAGGGLWRDFIRHWAHWRFCFIVGWAQSATY